MRTIYQDSIVKKTKNILRFALLSVVSSLMFWGCAPKFEEAKTLYDQGYYGQAAVTFENVYRNEEDKEKKEMALLLAAESYRLNNKYDRALKLYERVLRKDPNNTTALLMKANMLKKMEDYRKALGAYDDYLERVPGDSEVLMKMYGCELALRWTKDSSLFQVKEFKTANSSANDWAPMVASRKDDVIFFASDREGGMNKRIYSGTMEHWADIWYVEGKKAKKKRGQKADAEPQIEWNRPAFAKSASTKFNEGGLTFNRRFSEMYITQCGGTDGKSEKCAIYQMKKVGPDWQMGDPLEICKADSTHSYGHPALSPDDKVLYFSSDREGGYGGFDIWAVTYSRRSRSWGNPVNLGPTINSPGDEYYPYFNSHDNRLYFSSSWWPGLGGMDMFAADQTDDITKWENMENLREPLNSGGDDFAITFTGGNAKKGYFTSNRGSRRNDDDIYEFDVLPLVITIRGVVTDCNTNKPLVGATVTITNDKDTSKIIMKANENGEYLADLNPRTNYEITATFPELYYFEKPPVNRTTHGIRFSTQLEQDFCLINPLDQIYSLPIFYDLDSAAIRPDAAKVLDTFAQEVLIRYPRLIAELGSHTDCRASEDYNTRLAQRRADSARNYLMRRWNIDSARIVAVGFGEKELINDCKCEGAEKAGFTPYVAGKTRKMVIEKDRRGNVISSYYDSYKASEITTLEGKPFVKCDEFQHQQNRRTTVRFAFEDKKSRVKVNQDVDMNNTNSGSSTRDSVAKMDSAAQIAAAKPAVDLTYAVKLPITKDGDQISVPVMIQDLEPAMLIIDDKARVNVISPELAAEWYTKKIIKKKDFVSGDKFKVGKVKLPGNRFTVDLVKMGRYEVNGIQFKIDERAKGPTVGTRVLDKYFKSDSYKSDTEYVLIPKRVPREWKAKPVKEKPQRAPKGKKAPDNTDESEN
jgi:peptidoglycan-associated lipoprotein